MLFNILIPLYNSNYINIQLKSIYSLVLDGFVELNIIFIDDGSNSLFIKEYKKKIIYFSNKEKENKIKINLIELWDKKWKNRVSEARNIWVENSIWENIVFLDQDTILNKSYISNLICLNERYSDIDLITWFSYWYNNLKKNINKEDINFFINNWYVDKENFNDFRLGFYKQKYLEWRIWEFFWWTNFFIKKETYIKIWWFDENIITWWDEDIDFWYRLYKKWYNIIFDETYNVLNISSKLYKEPFKILINDNIDSLTSNFLYNYKKNKYSLDYKKYILDRFFSFDYNYKLNTNNLFQKEILKHDFYKIKRKKTVFFRLDDVKKISINLKKILKIFINYKIPLILAVEPWNIDNDTVIYVNIMKDKYPDLIEIVQHGYKHNNNSNTSYKYEFWDNVDYDTQLINIENWYNNMNKYFRNNFFKAFIPPYNNINLDTEKSLEQFDFKILSSGYPYENYLWTKGIISIPFFIDIIDSYNPLIFKNDNLVYNEILNYINRDWFVWLLLHPQYFSDENFRLLIKVLEYINKLDIEYSSLEQFYNNYNIDN